MNNEARLYKKMLILTVVIFVITTTTIVLHYESNTSLHFIGGKTKTYTTQEIRNMIKKLPDYQGDSLIINDDNTIKSLDGMIQSVIAQMYLVNENIKGIKREAENSGVPEPYLVYKTAIKYYIIQYGSKIKNPDSVNTMNK